jgi:hypothetical protein
MGICQSFLNYFCCCCSNSREEEPTAGPPAPANAETTLQRLARKGIVQPGVGWSGSLGGAAPPAPAPMAEDEYEEEGSTVDAVMAAAEDVMPAPVGADNNH